MVPKLVIFSFKLGGFTLFFFLIALITGNLKYDKGKSIISNPGV